MKFMEKKLFCIDVFDEIILYVGNKLLYLRLLGKNLMKIKILLQK